MKKKYIAPQMDVVTFAAEDVITSSSVIETDLEKIDPVN